MPAHEPNSAVIAAEASVAAKASLVAGDPNRPAYHFRPSCCWMNDPNGTIYHDGWYHVFYQFNPYSDISGNIHWGHTRSRDLVHWEQLPVAVWPSRELGEGACWSGCAAVTGSGEPIVFYTSCGIDNERPFQQWAALGDADWLTWRKHLRNPILALGEGGTPQFEPDWRDPFIFHSGGRTFLVLGAATTDQANVALFETEDPDLVDWRYRGLLYARPRSEMRFCECPNFFPLGDKFVLLLSPFKTVEYTIGAFDVDRLVFTPQTHGILDPGVSRLDHLGNVGNEAVHPNFYATNIAFDPDGNCVLFGWVRGFRPDQGWNGCLALPRLLTLGPDGHLRQQPAPALQQLRGRQLIDDGAVPLADDVQPLSGVSGDVLEMHATLTLGGASRAGLRLRAAENGDGGMAIEYDGRTLRVNETAVELPESPQVRLDMYLDKSVVEIFVNDGARAVTQVFYFASANRQIWLYAENGAARFTDLYAWELSSIW